MVGVALFVSVSEWLRDADADAESVSLCDCVADRERLWLSVPDSEVETVAEFEPDSSGVSVGSDDLVEVAAESVRDSVLLLDFDSDRD